MPAFFKTLQRAANDFNPQAAPRPAAVVLLSQKHEYVLSRTALALAIVVAAMIVGAFWLVHNEKPVLAAKTALAPAPKGRNVKAAKTAAGPGNAAHASGIVLSAASLLPPAPDMLAPPPASDPRVEVVARKIGDLPALAGASPAKQDIAPIVFEPDAGNEDQRLDDARLLLSAGEDEAALALYNHILARDGKNAAALAGKIYALERLGRAEDAVEAGHKLVQLDPRDAAARANLVTALGQSRSPQALAELRHMAAASPRDAAIQAALGKMLARRGYLEEAYAHLDRASRLAPGNVLYKLDLAILHDQANHTADALALYRQVLAAVTGSDDGENPAFSTQTIRARVNYLEAMQAAGSN